MPRPPTRPFKERQFKGPLILEALNKYVFKGSEPITEDEFLTAYQRLVLDRETKRREISTRRQQMHLFEGGQANNG